MSTTTRTYNLVLDEQERSELAELLRETLMETHVEMRRTETPAYQEKIHCEENVYRRLLEKVHALGA